MSIPTKCYSFRYYKEEERPFVMSVDKRNSSSHFFRLEYTNAQAGTVLWTTIGDDVSNPPVPITGTGSINVAYGYFGVGKVFIQGKVDRITFHRINGSNTSTIPLGIDDWGTLGLVSLENLLGTSRLSDNRFSYANFTYVPDWLPNTVTNVSYLFYRCINFNDAGVSSWDVSNVTNFGHLFRGDDGTSHTFNRPLNNWNMSNATTLSNMFYDNNQFNQPLNNWDVSNVTHFNSLFSSASLGGNIFNQDISMWNVCNATNMDGMFRRNTAFNQDLSGWTTPLIGSKPNNFDSDTPAWTKTNRQPQWGMECLGRPMMIEVTRTNTASGGDPWFQVVLGGTTDCYIKWGHQSGLGTHITSATTHNMSLTGDGDYTLIIRGKVSSINFKVDTANRYYCWKVTDWGDLDATSYQSLFYSPIDTAFSGGLEVPDWFPSTVTNTSHMFRNNQTAITNAQYWDMSNVTNMNNMFRNCIHFNSDISSWNVCNVRDMNSMFQNAQEFNQDLSGWKVPYISSKPTNFDTTTPSWVKIGRQPQWGVSCSV